MNQALLWLILSFSALTAVFEVFLLFRASRVFQNVSRGLRDELRSGREEARTSGKELREEVAKGLQSSSDTLFKTLEGMSKNQQNQLDAMTKQLKNLTDSSQTSLERIRGTVDGRLKDLQEGNEKKLDEMRKTVDEKLHDTLEKRLGASFNLVSMRLEAVHKGLGEMQNLASGVGDLKRVLTNVKLRGTWAEFQVAAILEQFLTGDQWAKNVCVKDDSLERVDYAVKLPGSKADPNGCIWLPIDCKFPIEDYERLQEASERADSSGVQEATVELIRKARSDARRIHDKYINPPKTTDIAIMFLRTEGLYAEVQRQPGLVEEIQSKYRIVITGPANLAALLSSFRMGFQTLALEQRAEEVWKVLGGVKTEFAQFGEVLEKVKRQLNSASKTIDETGVRTRAMERKLRSVEQLPEDESARILELPEATEEVESEPVGAGGFEPPTPSV